MTRKSEICNYPGPCGWKHNRSDMRRLARRASTLGMKANELFNALEELLGPEAPETSKASGIMCAIDDLMFHIEGQTTKRLPPPEEVRASLNRVVMAIARGDLATVQPVETKGERG